jgi:hypothetical protein
MANIIILVEMLTNCNPIHRPDRVPLIKQQLFEI